MTLDSKSGEVLARTGVKGPDEGFNQKVNDIY